MRAIDADALIRELTSVKVTFGSSNGLVEGGLSIAISMVNNAPTVEPERKKGKWLKKEVTHIDDLEAKDIITEWQSAKCNVCGKYHTTPYMYYFSDYDFCPNCGARMEGMEE